MTIKPIKKHILFSFLEKTNSKGQFERKTESGLILTSDFDNSAKSPRWAVITHVGPDSEYLVGQKILIQPLMWTEHIVFQGKKMWKTDDSKVVALDVDGILAPVKKYVLMTREVKNMNTTSSGLFVVQKPDETGNGIVVLVGNDVINKDIIERRVQFKDINFFNNFKHNGFEYWYISEEDIYCYEVVD